MAGFSFCREVAGVDLFEAARREEALSKAPLAARMRPRTLDEFVGQEPVVGPGSLLRRMAESGRLTYLILYGHPGTGKTTLARIIAEAAAAHFDTVKAVTAGLTAIRKSIHEEKIRRTLYV